MTSNVPVWRATSGAPGLAVTMFEPVRAALRRVRARVPTLAELVVGNASYDIPLHTPVPAPPPAPTSAQGMVPVGAFPTGVAVSPEGARVYVVNSGDDSVSVIDTDTATAAITIAVGRAPYGIALSPDGRTAYVANAGGNSVSVIDTHAFAVASTIAVGENPYGVAVAPDGQRVLRDESGRRVADRHRLQKYRCQVRHRRRHCAHRRGRERRRAAGLHRRQRGAHADRRRHRGGQSQGHHSGGQAPGPGRDHPRRHPGFRHERRGRFGFGGRSHDHGGDRNPAGQRAPDRSRGRRRRRLRLCHRARRITSRGHGHDHRYSDGRDQHHSRGRALRRRSTSRRRLRLHHGLSRPDGVDSHGTRTLRRFPERFAWRQQRARRSPSTAMPPMSLPTRTTAECSSFTPTTTRSR